MAMNKSETPEERFKRLATLRTNAVLEKLRLLGNLSNKQVYRYSEEDLDRVFSAINKQTREVRAKFKPGKQQGFKL